MLIIDLLISSSASLSASSPVLLLIRLLQYNWSPLDKLDDLRRFSNVFFFKTDQPDGDVTLYKDCNFLV